MGNLSGPDWIVLGAYLAVVLGFGIAFTRRQRSKEDFFVGSRQMNWFAVGLSLFAAAFSSVSFVMLPREGMYRDFHLFVAILFIPLVITPLLWWVFVPLYTRLGITSVYQYLELRFHRSLRRLGTVLFAGYALGWLGSMLYAVGIILQVVLRKDLPLAGTMIALGLVAILYTSLGGVKAVIWIDMLQAITLGGVVVVILALSLGRIEGGLPAVVQLGLEHDKFRWLDFDLDLGKKGFFWACALGLFMYLPGYTTSQVTVQRYVCMPTLRDARRALLLNAAMATGAYFLFMFVGTTIFAYYQQAGAAPSLAKEDQILPYFVARELAYPGLTGLMIAGLLAAAMSTLDGGINSLTAVAVYDWLAGRNVGVAGSRGLTVLVGLCVIGAGLLVPYLGQNVIDILTRITGTFLGLLLGVYLLGMFVPRANTGGTWLGVASGIACLAAVAAATEVPAWWYGACACLPTVVVGTLASFAFAPPRADQLQGLVSHKPDKP